MKYGWMSGFLWALDTVLLGVVLSQILPEEEGGKIFWMFPVISAWLHDFFSAGWLFLLTFITGKFKQLAKACFTKHGVVVIVAALLGGPIGMTGYLTAIEHIGSGYTACISAFYPAFGALMARVFLKERLSLVQYVGLFLALMGVMGIGWITAGAGEIKEPVLGISAAIVCVVGWGMEAVLGSYAMRHEALDNHVALQIRNTVSAIAYGVLLLCLGDLCFVRPFVNKLHLVGLCALVGTLSYLFYYKAISLIGASKGMALNITYAAWALVLGFIFCDADISALSFVFCILILIGTVMSATSIFVVKKEEVNQ